MVWREAELPDESNIGVRANVPFLNEKGQGASGGMYFSIDRKVDPEAAPDGYYAQYELNVQLRNLPCLDCRNAVSCWLGFALLDPVGWRVAD